jgi:ankyrin repeat protein
MTVTIPDIISLAKYLGYPTNKEGLCYGISGMGIQALLCNDLSTFDQRMKIIGELMEQTSIKDLTQAIQTIEKKRVNRIKEFKEQLLKDLNQDVKMCARKFYLLLQREKDNNLVKKFNIQRNSVDHNLSDTEKKLVDIRAFIEGVIFNFSPYYFREWFANPASIQQQNLELSFLKTLPDEFTKMSVVPQQQSATTEKGVLKEKDESLVTKLKVEVGLYDKKELITYFSLLRTYLPYTAFHLLGYDHAITVFYDNQANCWRFIDQSSSEMYQSDGDLAHVVMNSFKGRNSVAFGTDIYCKNNDINKVTNRLLVLSRNLLWKKLYELRQKRSLTQGNSTYLLYIAAENGRVDVVKTLLQYKNLTVNKSLKNGGTPLLIAANNGYVDVVKALLDSKKLDVNKASHIGTTPLFIASSKGHADIVKILLACKKIDVNKANVEEKTPLFTAVQLGQIDIVNILLEREELDVNKAMSNGATPLSIATEIGNITMVKALLNTGKVQLNKCMNEGTVTPIYIAAQIGHIEIMGELLKSPLSKEILNRPIKISIEALLVRAIKANREAEVLELLQNKGITSSELDGFTPLFAAIFFKHTEIVKMLINQGANLEQTAQGQISALEFAQAMDHKEIIELLMPAFSKSKADTSKISISLSDLSLKSGSDFRTPWIKGKNLAVESTKRAAFFAQRPITHAAFTRLSQNPLFIEKTTGPTESKGPAGEYFIPPEEFAKLIAARIIKYEHRNSLGQYFDTKNVYIIDNNPNVLHQKLKESQIILEIESGNLKINYIDEDHQIAIYLRNVSGTIYCYFSDSQSASTCTKSLIPTINRYFPGAKIIVGPDIQRDYYGCFNFGEKSDQLFIKEGAQIFSHIEKNKRHLIPVTENINDVPVNYSLLTQQGLMPKLLKLSQTLNTGESLSSETLNTLVSYKKNETLENYLARNTIQLDNKKINAAILIKKYKRIDELEELAHNAQVLSKVKSIYFAPPINYLIQNKRLDQLKSLLMSQKEVLTEKIGVLETKEEHAGQLYHEFRLTPILFVIRELINQIELKQTARKIIEIEMNKIHNTVMEQQLEPDLSNNETVELLLEESEERVESQKLKIDKIDSSIQCYLKMVEEMAKMLNAKEVLLDNQELGLLINAIENNDNLNTMLMENETILNYLTFLHIDFPREQQFSLPF